MRTAAIAATLAAVTFAAGLATPAAARIVCRGDFQVVNGNHISTPYCRDKHLASIARKNGFRISEREIMNNPNSKRDLCRYLRHNIEAQAACEDVNVGIGVPRF